MVKCYDLTRVCDLEHSVRRSDVVVTAVPDASFRLKPSWVKEGAAVLDHSHQGNVDARELAGLALLYTVAENRLGKVTRAMIFVNLVYCARYRGDFY